MFKFKQPSTKNLFYKNYWWLLTWKFCWLFRHMQSNEYATALIKNKIFMTVNVNLWSNWSGWINIGIQENVTCQIGKLHSGRMCKRVWVFGSCVCWEFQMIAPMCVNNNIFIGELFRMNDSGVPAHHRCCICDQMEGWRGVSAKADILRPFP